MTIVTSTSAARKPEQRNAIANVSTSVGTLPALEMLSAGRGRTSGSEVMILMV